jgi:transporter family-2 protein
MSYWPLLLGIASAALTMGSGMNGAVSQRIGIFPGVLIYLTVGSLCSVLGLLLFPEARFSPHLLLGQPPDLFLPGLFNLGVIAAQLRILRAAGVATLTGGIFVGQAIAGILLDNFGFLGQPTIALTWRRLLGVVLAFLGLQVLLRARAAPESRSGSSWAWGGLAIAVGAIMGMFADLNARLGEAIGLTGATLLFLLPGALMLTAAALVGALTVNVPSTRTLPLRYLLIPGAANFSLIFVQNRTVTLIGVGASVAIAFLFQMTSALAIDACGWFQLARRDIRLSHVIGLLVMLGGVLLMYATALA